VLQQGQQIFVLKVGSLGKSCAAVPTRESRPVVGLRQWICKLYTRGRSVCAALQCLTHSRARSLDYLRYTTTISKCDHVWPPARSITAWRKSTRAEHGAADFATGAAQFYYVNATPNFEKVWFFLFIPTDFRSGRLCGQVPYAR
jgi:hypothetical protein